MKTVEDLGQDIGVVPACRAIGISRATFYRRGNTRVDSPKSKHPKPARAISEAEKQEVLSVLHDPRYVDLSPSEIYARLLDTGVYLCSSRTMYRILGQNGEVRERRRHLQHPNYAKPELLATGPNQVWSWDITKLLGPVKWTYFYLYVILDIFSRYAVGWMLATRESATLAQRLIRETCQKEEIVEGQLTIHSDRGPSMKSQPVAHLLAHLGVTKTHSRPYVSNDNPFSEAQFKTLKYRPDFPQRFGSFEDARSHCRTFFPWYNTEHRHSGIGLMTPEMIHQGQAPGITEHRRQVLHRAYEAHPGRFVRKRPVPPRVPNAVWPGD